ncbi:MAG: hypothetical protein OXI95_07025 [bacterium]|nr:hypothetical protein [bacterium]MDE0416673.1 hypothetical protein [bacterium]
MAPSSPMLTVLLLASCAAVALFLFRSRMARGDLWHATLTPLSSIIGSGFLIMAPLLASIVGPMAPVAILGIVLFAFAIGHVIRFNILHVEPRLADGRLHKGTREIEYLGNVVLVGAYIIAVAFYLSLLSSFLLGYLGVDDPDMERGLTTIVIVFIAGVGYLKGLGGLERLESISVTIQLCVIASLITGLAIYGFGFLTEGELHLDFPQRDVFTQLQMLAGALLVVQGFETSRFLGERYSPEIRVKSMRNAQLISGFIYVVSVILLMPVVQAMDLVHIRLAQIVDAVAPVALILPVMLMIAALTSQFSAAVADSGGAGGLLRENSHGHLSVRMGYVSVAAAAILLVWAVNLLEIVALASRAFAAYYFLQTLLALIYNYRDSPQRSRLRRVDTCLFIALALILAYIVAFSIPAE